MRIFHLRPKPEHLKSPEWSGSTYRGECFAYEEDEGQALRAAFVAFCASGFRKPPDQQASANPWGNPELVTIHEVKHMASTLPAKGSVAMC